MWKTVGVSKVSVIYIYIYINNNNNKRRERERETIKERPRMCLDQDEPMFGILPFFPFKLKKKEKRK